jgi:hypothetical protein
MRDELALNETTESTLLMSKNELFTAKNSTCSKKYDIWAYKRPQKKPGQDEGWND